MISSPSQIPSYVQGFARRQGESACPELWRGLVGLWAPLLGPTGEVVFGWSSRGQAHNGTLTGMDAGTDWVGGRHGWALDVPAANGYVNCGAPSALAFTGRPNVSVFALVRLHSVKPFGGIWDNSTGGGPTQVRFTFLATTYGRLRLAIGNGTAYSSFHSDSGTLSLDTWLHVGVTVSADNQIVFYCNGKACGVGTLDRDLAPSPTSWKIGRAFSAAGSDFGLDGLLATLAVYDRTLPPGTVRQLCRVPAAHLHLRRRVLGVLPPLGGPYRAVTGQTFHTGAAAGEPFSTGAATGGTFSTGSIMGECHGRSG